MKCQAIVTDETGWHDIQCSRNATVERNGQHWCWQHDPLRIADIERKNSKKWAAQLEHDRWVYAAQDVCEGVSLETLKQLGKGKLKELLGG